MGEACENPRRSRSSTSPDVEAGVNVEGSDDVTDVAIDGSNSSVLTDRNLSKENIVHGEPSTSNDVAKSGGAKYHSKLSVRIAKIFDEKVPLKKRLKWLRRLAFVEKDGTVQLEVPGYIKSPSLDLGTKGDVNYDDMEVVEEVDSTGIQDLQPMQIVMLIVGTRGDVQPFVAIGRRLQEDGHRVRLATHRNFKEFVLSAGLEFYPLGGDPKVLASYMVKNKGFLPSEPSEIHIQRNQIKEIIFSLLPACKDRDPESQVPFSPDAIIANPPAYG